MHLVSQTLTTLPASFAIHEERLLRHGLWLATLFAKSPADVRLALRTARYRRLALSSMKLVDPFQVTVQGALAPKALRESPLTLRIDSHDHLLSFRYEPIIAWISLAVFSYRQTLPT